MRRIVFLAAVLASRATVLFAETALAQLKMADASGEPSFQSNGGVTTQNVDIPHGQPVLYPLREIERDNMVYFFDAAWPRVKSGRWQKTEKYNPPFAQGSWQQEDRVLASGVGSNVLVYAYKPREDFSGRVAAVPGITAWFDPRGYVHTVEVLQEQVAFDYLLQRRCGEIRSSGGCNLHNGRGQSLRIELIPLTGIMDEETLKIALLQMELKYDGLYTSLMAECAKAGQQASRCSGGSWPNSILGVWHSELEQVRTSLDKYSAALDLVARQMSAPGAVPPMYWHYSTVPNGAESGGGFSDDELHISLQECVPEPSWGTGCRWRDRPESYFTPNSNEPELAVTRSLSPSESSVCMDALPALENEARDFLSKAEREGAALLGDQ